MIRLRKRPNQNLSIHSVETFGRNYLVKRLKEPFILVLYDPIKKSGEIYKPSNPLSIINPEIFNSKKFSEKEIQSALKKAVAWAKHNIK